jgi:hypothetical protein
MFTVLNFTLNNIVGLQREHLHVAAIDNGLAFPFKHPDRWRSYPYGWLNLPLSHIPFTKRTKEHLLPILTSSLWWHQTAQDLYRLFCIDADFDEDMFARQLAVMKGQIHNLVEILTNLGEGFMCPQNLYNTPNLLVWEEVVNEEEEEACEGETSFGQSDSNQRLIDELNSGRGTSSGNISPLKTLSLSREPIQHHPSPHADPIPATPGATHSGTSENEQTAIRSPRLSKSYMSSIPLSSSHLPVAGTSSSMIDPPKQFQMPRPPKKIRRKLRKAKRSTKSKLYQSSKGTRRVKKKVIERLESLHIRPWFTWC